MVKGNVTGDSASVLRERVAAIRWFHSIELPDGVVTPGADDTRARVGILQMPKDLSGKSVLDIGAWDGFFSFEAERRGASRVVAADSFAWNGSDWSSKAGFELARNALRSTVQDVEVDVMDLNPERLGKFDLVLFLGVLYHLRHPLLALERVASVTGEQLILETHVDLTWTRRPAMAMYPTTELGLDPTNWWGPNPAAVAAMLRDVGFSDVRMMTPNSLAYRAARAVPRVPGYLRFLRAYRIPPTGGFSHGRAVFHAFR
jgi:tRNA (mo5U34)-methyltransferase